MSTSDESATRAFSEALSRHGYGFQYAVLKEARSLYFAGKSPWAPWVPEFPVEVQGKGTRIDLLFRHKKRPWYLICECKRANPAWANWCFARVPWPEDSLFATQSYIEMIKYDGNRVEFELQTLLESDRIFQLALEVKTGMKGDPESGSSDRIEEAATQLFRGYNGLIPFLGGERVHNLVNINETIGFVPAIITTANLLATRAEIYASDITKGNIGPIVPPLEPMEWLWYDYPQSPGIRHNIPDQIHSANLRELFYREFVRRVAVVAPLGLSSFLCGGLWSF